MARPVRSGMRFCFALGDGRRSVGIVIAERGKLVDAAFAVPGGSAPAIRVLCTLRAFNDRRWRAVREPFPAGVPGAFDIAGVASPGLAERTVLHRAGGPAFVTRLRIVDGTPDTIVADGRRSIRIANGRTGIPDACVALDVSGVAIDRARIAALSNLRALRLSRIPGRVHLAPLRGAGLRSLALEHVDVTDLHELAAWEHLEELELRGFWQYHPGDVAWLRALPRLRRLTIDLGGRRKNVEVYRHLDVACAWPFDLTMANASGGNTGNV